MPAAPAPRRTPAQLAADGFAVLVEKLGAADAIRFLQRYDPGQGDYTTDRREWLDSLSLAGVTRLVRKANRADRSAKKPIRKN